MKMKSAGVVDGGLFTESYCNICNAQLISESQRTAHYESKKHANKVRLFYMLHPEDGGPPSKRLRPDNPVCSLHECSETEVDRNKCCTLCNMFFTSAIVAQSHYQGKTHAKRVRLTPPLPPRCPQTPLRAPLLPLTWHGPWAWSGETVEEKRGSTAAWRRLVQQPADGPAALRGQETPQECSQSTPPGAASGQSGCHGEHRSDSWPRAYTSDKRRAGRELALCNTKDDKGENRFKICGSEGGLK
ncbi:hypothetical protein F7725_024040, partial [Dissostichus mawsoni]